MSAARAPSPQPTPDDRPSHGPPGAYDRFLKAANEFGPDRASRLHHAYLRFAYHYPDLTEWLRRPLRERLGWRHGEQQHRRATPEDGDLDPTLGWINRNARHYLVYLSLTGRLRLDWAWLLGMGVLKPWLTAQALGLPLVAQTDRLLTRFEELGVTRQNSRSAVHWGVVRLVLHRADPDLATLTIDDVEELRAAIRDLGSIPEIDQVLDPERLHHFTGTWGTFAFRTGVALFHAGVTDRLPQRQPTRPPQPLSTRPRIVVVMDRYVADRMLRDRPASLDAARTTLRRLSAWLDAERPQVETLAVLRRADLLDFLTWLGVQTKERSSEPLSPGYRRGIIWHVMDFFRYVCESEWDDVPPRAPLIRADVPRTPLRVPRFIPEAQLAPLMDAIRTLACPLQRTALLVARWSGARRSEIRRLHLDCLDAYPDGTARLRLAVGKSRKERMVPVHQEAADAIRALQAIRQPQPDRGLIDADLGRRVRYLFLRKGRLADDEYLFEAPLTAICVNLGLTDPDTGPQITPHRFRHTLGTQLAERGARVRTIMAILGHQSASMSMTYAAISDETVLRDYQSVLGPGAVLAGPQATAIHAGAIDQDGLDWLRTNFFKTELELGRCLRLPQEGPCECDLYLSCAKFVTTPEYAPRLRDRLQVEQQLIADAHERGWPREVERHQRITERLRCLLAELGEQHPPQADPEP